MSHGICGLGIASYTCIKNFREFCSKIFNLVQLVIDYNQCLIDCSRKLSQDLNLKKMNPACYIRTRPRSSLQADLFCLYYMMIAVGVFIRSHVRAKRKPQCFAGHISCFKKFLPMSDTANLYPIFS